MLKTIEYWKNFLGMLGVRVQRRRMWRNRVDMGCSYETLEPRIAMSVVPVIIGVSVSPDIVPYGSQVTLVATGVTDPGGAAITEMRFHIDADNDGQLTPADGVPLALDTNGSDGWSAGVSTLLSSGGNQRYFAVAKNASGIDSEAVSVTNTVLLPPKLIDNGGAGYSVVSSNYWSTSGGGYGGGHQFEFGSTGGYAQWTFSDLPAGDYRVFATWLNASNHGSNVPYTVLDGSLDVGTTRVNQRVAPAADVVAGSKNFQNLGSFSVVNGSLVVRMTNSSGDGRAIADAVRIEHIGPAQQVSDILVFNGSAELADGVSSVNLGTTFFGTPTASTTLTVRNVGLADLVLAPLTQANMPAGVTLVSSYGATTLARGESTTFQVQLAATSPGNVSGIMTLPSNDSDEANFQVTLTGVVNASKVSDNGAAGYSTVSAGYWSTSGGGYGGGHQFEFGATGGYAQWTFPNLPAGSYRVSTTWLAASNRGTNVPYNVFDGSFDVGMTQVNQRLAPAADVVVGSTTFQNIGTFSIVNGSLVVRVTNSSGDGRAIADAVRIEYLGAVRQTSDIRVFNGSTELKDGASSVNLGTTFVGTSTAPTTFTVKNAGLSDLVLTPLTQANMPAGVSLVSSYESTTIPRGGSTTFQVMLSAARTGAVNGNLYLLSDDHNKAAFDIRLSGTVNASRIVDNGSSGYATVSNNYWSTSGGGYGGGHQFEFGASGGYAEWTFPNLLPGSYRVSTTWLQSTNRGTNVPYTIYDASSNVGAVAVNQRIAPAADAVIGSTNFQDLGTWSVVNGSLVVRVTNSSGDGRAIADAVRLEYLGPLPIDPANVAAGFANGRLDIVGTAANDTVTIGTVNVGGVDYVVVNGNGVGGGVRASDITQIVADLKAGDDTMDVSTLDLTKFIGLTDGSITVYGGAGNDTLTGSSLGDVIYGEDGDDLIFGGAGDDYLSGGNGQDIIWGHEGNDWVYGDDGDDDLRGNEGNDFLFGGDGQDYLGGATGNDLLHGNAGDDDLHGAVGDDLVYGDAGDDMVYGGTGRDFVYGGSGDDLLLGRHNNDDLIGGVGNDTYRFEVFASTGFDRINELPGEGDDVVDVTSLTLLNTLNPNSTAAQFLTSYQSLQFMTAGTVETILGNTTNSYESTTVDDGDSGFTTVSSQAWASSVGGYENDYRYDSGATDGYAEWTFANLPAGEYWVSGTWVAGTDRSTSVSYTAYDGSLEVGATRVNQKLAPAPHRVVGTTKFQNIGTFSVVNGSLVVRMANSSGDGKAVADAIRIERIGSPQQIANIRVFNGATELTPAESTVDLGTTFVGFPTPATTLTVENVGLADLVLTPLTQADMPAGVTLVTSYANTVLARGQSTTFQIRLAATNVEAIDDDLLILSNDADEGTFGIAISGTVRGAEIIDDEDPGFVVVSGTWQETTGGFGDDHVVSSLADSAVEWRFTDLVSGRYRISATWPHAANFSSAASYTITGGSSGVASVLVNQQNAPRADVTSGDRDFEDLGSFHVFEGGLVVRLSSTSAASVSADAIRLEYLGPPVPSDVASFANGQLVVVGSASNDAVAIGTVNVGGVPFLVVNGQMVGAGVRAADVTAINVDLGDGDDTIDLSSLDLFAFTGLSDGAVTIHGGAGQDTIQGTPLGDVLHGDDGDDEILGHGGNDTIDGGNGGDRLVGGDGDDTYVIGSPGDTGIDTIDEAANGGTDRVDLTGLSPLQQISVGSTAVQSVTNDQSLQFVNAGTVESILGRVSRRGGGGILTMPGDPGQDLDATLQFGGYSWILEESESGSVVVFEVDDEGYPLQSGPGGQIEPLRSFDFDLDSQSVSFQSVETTFPSGTYLAFYFEFDGERFYSIPGMNEGNYSVGEALGFSGSTDFGWTIGDYYNPGYSDLYLNVALVQAVGGITVEANPIRGKEGELSNVEFTFTRYAITDEYGNEDPDSFEEPGVVAWVPLYGSLGGELMYSNFTSSVQDGGHLHALIPAGERSVTLTFPMTDADNEYPGPAIMIGAGLAGYYPWSGGVTAIDGEYDPYSYAFVTIYDDDTVDLDIDSDNSGTIDYSLDEESLEAKAGAPGKILAVGGARAKMTIAHRNDGELKLIVEAGGADKVRFWTSEYGGSEIPYGSEGLDSSSLQGLFGSQTIWVEAIKPSESAGDIVVTLQGPDGSEDSDTVRLTVAEVDLDVNSDNVGGASLDAIEDAIEDIADIDATPGLYLQVQDEDADGDGIVNWADGFGGLGTEENNIDDETSYGAAFEPIYFNIPEYLYNPLATVEIFYSASVPSPEVMDPHYVSWDRPTDGHLRLWTKDASVPRDRASVKENGDFVAASTAQAPVLYTLAELNLVPGVNPLFLEAIRESTSVGQQAIRFRFTPQFNGQPVPFSLEDQVRVTTARIEVMADNRDGTPQFPTFGLTATRMPNPNAGLSGLIPEFTQAYTINVYDPRGPQTIHTVYVAEKALPLAKIGTGRYATATPFIAVPEEDIALIDSDAPVEGLLDGPLRPSGVINGATVVPVSESSVQIRYNGNTTLPVFQPEALEAIRKFMEELANEVAPGMATFDPLDAAGNAGREYELDDSGALGAEYEARINDKRLAIAEDAAEPESRRALARQIRTNLRVDENGIVLNRQPNTLGSAQIDFIYLKEGYEPQVGTEIDRNSFVPIEVRTTESGLLTKDRIAIRERFSAYKVVVVDSPWRYKQIDGVLTIVPNARPKATAMFVQVIGRRVVKIAGYAGAVGVLVTNLSSETWAAEQDIVDRMIQLGPIDRRRGNEVLREKFADLLVEWYTNRFGEEGAQLIYREALGNGTPAFNDLLTKWNANLPNMHRSTDQ